MDSCPACHSTDLNDQGYHPQGNGVAHVLLCKGCGVYLVREVTLVVIGPGQLLNRFLLERLAALDAPRVLVNGVDQGPGTVETRPDDAHPGWAL